MRRLAFLATLAIAGLALACNGGEEPSHTATPGPSPSGTAAAPSTVTATPAVTQAPPSAAQPIALEEGATLSEAGLYLVETATGRLWHLEGSAAWSPDGKSLVRWSCCLGGGGLDVIEVPGGPAVRIFDGGVDTAVWSPDGTQIAFSRWAEGPEGVYVVNSDGSALRELSPRGTHSVQWSRAGDRLAFYRDDHVYVLDVESGQTVDLPDVADFSFSWSPDGAELALGNETGLYVYDADTGERRQVASGPSGDPILWSPDGSRIAFPFGPLVPFAYGPYANDPEVGVRVLHVVDVQGSEEPRPLSPARYSAWSPDSTKLAYVREGCITGNWDIYSVAADGSSEVRLTNTPKTVKEGPFWSPTGATIAFSTFGELILLDAESGNLRALVVSGWPETLGRDIHLHGPVWSPDGRYIQFTAGTAHGICD